VTRSDAIAAFVAHHAAWLAYCRSGKTYDDISALLRADDDVFVRGNK
jgi:hypothetical protein